MNATLLHSILFWLWTLGTVCGTPPVKEGSPWKTDRLLRAIDHSAQGIMAEYEAWAVDWMKGDKKPTENDRTINRLTEGYFVTLMNALAMAPNPELLTQSLRFLDSNVPPEFDDMWSFVFIEFSNVSTGANGRPLRSQHLENLKKRAMKPK